MPKSPHRRDDPRRRRGESRRETGWDAVASWYDKLIGDEGSDYHRHVILPAALRMMDVRGGESVVDVCCGQGVLTPLVVDAGAARYVGVDASPRLIAAARQRHGSARGVDFVVADACVPGAWADASHDVAACLMAVHDVGDAAGLFVSAAAALKPGGRLVCVLMHPCFRVPKLTHWGWDADQKVQYRRVDSYLGVHEIQITTHPGRGTGEHTVFHHRPLGEVLSALGSAGLAVVRCEELCSHRRPQAAGPFSRAEARAADEFPLFLALRALKLG